MATDFPASPSNGDTHAGFTYNSTTGTWETSVSTSSIDLLTDVDTATAAPTTGQLLRWNGTNWAPYTPPLGEVDQWRITADLTSDADPVSSNLARVNDASFAKIGTGMSVSSGVWTFPNTGLWKVSFNVSCYFTVTDLAIRAIIQASSDSGTNWDNLANFKMGADYSTNNFSHGAGESFINVTNTSTIKLRFSLTSISSGNTVIGEAARSDTYFSFMRLGDSQ